MCSGVREGWQMHGDPLYLNGEDRNQGRPMGARVGKGGVQDQPIPVNQNSLFILFQLSTRNKNSKAPIVRPTDHKHK